MHSESHSVPAEFLSQVPSSLHSIVENLWNDWCQSCESKEIDPVQGVDLAVLGKTWACSDFIARTCIRYPQMLHALSDEGWDKGRSMDDYRALVDEVLSAATDDITLMRTIRELRQREMSRIAWRDLNGLADDATILYEITDLAEAMVAVTLRHLEKQQAESFGMPLDSNGDEQELLVFAMGKMGGRELNFSSDIDLIFSFAEEGETPGPRKKSHYEFYLAVIRKLVKLLDEVTADGFVYRVDTRLRPFGQSGPMAMSFSGLEQYYQLHGRDWERYAMIKAKLITGRKEDRKYLQSMLTPFVYRRYLDFSMIDSIREMKSMINAQMKRKRMTNNIKLGPGGIREIEFIGQTLQLIRAGREPDLRKRSIIEVLTLLAQKCYLQQHESEDLISAYWYLRKLENRLQMLADKQTHVLPDDDISQQRICLAMGQPDWDSLIAELVEHQAAVDNVFQHLIATEEEKGEEPSVTALTLFLSDAAKRDDSDHSVKQYLESLGYQQADEVVEIIVHLHASSQIRHLTGDTARMMFQLIESLIEKIADYPKQAVLFDRASRILKALAGRKVYISLLNEFPAIQLQMLTLCQASEWFTERLTKYPILLDSLLSTAEAFRHQYDIKHLLELELERVDGYKVASDADEVAELDLEQLMERMRQFKRQTVFTVAMLDVFYAEPVETVSDHLTDLANALLEKILQFSWQAMAARHGEPQCVIDDEVVYPQMSIVAYGKMGGNELGYGSDLDIIFIHNSDGEKQYTNGEKSIDNQQFFARVAQRVIHFLNTRTYSGILYEADTRLRPDGQSGLMVSSITAFEQYQKEKAWTWEHQALIRARFVTGSALIEQEFDRIRGSVLCSVVKDLGGEDKLLREVVAMREKMRQHLANKSEAFDVKQDAGGLVDIEFMTQAGVLIHAEANADCLRHTATLELIKELKDIGWYEAEEAENIADAYRYFRKLKNWQKLKCESDETDVAQHRDNVKAVWQRLMPAPVEAG